MKERPDVADSAGGRRGHDSREAGGLYRLQRAKNQFSPERNAALLDFSAGRPVSHLCPLEPQGTTLVLVKLLRLCFFCYSSHWELHQWVTKPPHNGSWRVTGEKWFWVG